MKIIKAEDKELYSYGLYQGIVHLLNFLVILLIGFVLQMLWQSMIFTLCYSILRSYAGGYHARTQGKCFILSVLMVTSVLVLLMIIPSSTVLILTLLGISYCLLLSLAPVEDENKPLDDMEFTIFRKKAIVISSSLVVFSTILLLTSQKDIALVVATSVTVASIMVVIGLVKNYQVKRLG